MLSAVGHFMLPMPALFDEVVSVRWRADPQQVLQTQNTIVPWTFSPDGRWQSYQGRNPNSGQDIRTLPLDITDPDHPRAGKPEPFLRTPDDGVIPRFSPDGHWIAYRSTNESGNVEIYVRPFPNAGGGRWQISSGGGLYAFWSNNGRELFFETADNRIMEVDYAVDGGSFVPGRRRLWSDKQLFYTGTDRVRPGKFRLAAYSAVVREGPTRIEATT
jgi:serine/threonine-protein kinase